MHSEYLTSTPRPTDYFSQIYANLRLIKQLFEERYILDHHMNMDDDTDSDGHDKITIQGITVDMYADSRPYPMNWITGIAQLPESGTILFCKKVGNNNKLCYACKDINGNLKEIILR